MAEEDRIRVAAGVTRRDCCWGYYLEGSKEALRSGGFAREDWFPGNERDKRGRTIRTTHFEHEGRNWSCTMESKKRYLLRHHFTDEELERNRIREDFENAQTEEQKELGAMPATHDDYREQAARFVGGWMESLRAICDQPKYHGYRYSPDVITQLELKFQEIVGILETGRTFFDATARQSRVAEIKARSAKANPELKAFLDSVVKTSTSS